MERKSGILMPIFSLPSKYGIGTLGKEAYKFADFLAAAGQSVWQLLPLGPTSYADSPYSSFSSAAGNPWLIDDGEDGLLFPARDSAALARCIARLMDEPELLARMGRRAREIFGTRFTGEIMARNIESVYEAAVKGE